MILLLLAVAVIALFVAMVLAIHGEQAARDREAAYWNGVARRILERDPKADVSFCFRRNRPPYRCPGPPRVD